MGGRRSGSSLGVVVAVRVAGSIREILGIWGDEHGYQRASGGGGGCITAGDVSRTLVKMVDARPRPSGFVWGGVRNRARDLEVQAPHRSDLGRARPRPRHCCPLLSPAISACSIIVVQASASDVALLAARDARSKPLAVFLKISPLVVACRRSRVARGTEPAHSALATLVIAINTRRR